MGLPLPLILGAVQAGSGLIGRMATRRKKYEIPSEVRQATALASLAAQQEAPGSTQARGDIRIAAANALAGARETGGAQTQLAGIVGAQRSQLRDLAATQAQYSAGALDRYRGALETMGQYQDLEYQINEMAPFQDAARLTEDVFGAGMQNLFEGLGMVEPGGAGTPDDETEETEERTSPAAILGASFVPGAGAAMQARTKPAFDLYSRMTARGVGAATQYANPYMSAIMNLYNR